MAGEVTKFDPAVLMQPVKDRIREEFSSLIPDEAWQSMIKTELDKFLKDELPKLIRSEIEVLAKKEIEKVLNGDYWRESWGVSGSRQTSEAVKNMIRDNMPEIITGIIGRAMGDLISQLRSNIASNMQRY